MGLVIDAADFAGYMERALERADYAGFAARKSSARRPRGIGIANYVESPVGAARERVELQVTKAGIDIITGTQSSGQGHETAFVQIAADQLQLPMDKIRLRTGDTAFVKTGGGSHSDRSLRFAGTLLVSSGRKLLDAGREAAAARLEVRADDLSYEGGVFRVAGTDRAIALLDLAPLAASDEINARLPVTPGGCAVCEIEVDPETGAVDVLRYITVDDVGRAVNPLIVHGQTHGGIAQGIGQALMEGVSLDEANQVLTGSFMDYGLARAGDLPAFETELAEVPAQGNPLGVKGGGEGGVVPATAAVINALCDALGVDDVAMPATPQRVWRVLQTRAR
jgi:carbon-monoxide dehydrogenase large subunit